jgi:alpha-L-arabinofuranosidase
VGIGSHVLIFAKASGYHSLSPWSLASNRSVKLSSELRVIALRGAEVASASGTVLAASEMHVHNTFDHPNAVMSTTLAITVGAGLLNVSIPAASVTKLEIVLR